MPRYARQHNHYAQGGSVSEAMIGPERYCCRLTSEKQEREWQNNRDGYEISDSRLNAMDAERDAERRRARAQFDSGGGLGGGRILPNGKYEWISVGGGHRRYWSEKYNDYK